jgi:hypothetical protein
VNVAIVAGLLAAALVIHDPIVACAQEGSPEHQTGGRLFR